MNKHLFTLALLALALPARAAELGIAGTAGTLGLGAELTIGGTDQFQGRLGIHGY